MTYKGQTFEVLMEAGIHSATSSSASPSDPWTTVTPRRFMRVRVSY